MAKKTKKTKKHNKSYKSKLPFKKILHNHKIRYSITAILLSAALFFILSVAGVLKSGEKLEVLSNKTDEVKATFYVEIADEPSEHKKGLMHVKSMAKDKGMIFIFDNERKVNMWMKNTYIPLDMLFIDKNKMVVTMAENRTILSETLISSQVPVKYVLEINAGVARKHNIKVGDKINF